LLEEGFSTVSASAIGIWVQNAFSSIPTNLAPQAGWHFDLLWNYFTGGRDLVEATIRATGSYLIAKGATIATGALVTAGVISGPVGWIIAGGVALVGGAAFNRYYDDIMAVITHIDLDAIDLSEERVNEVREFIEASLRPPTPQPPPCPDYTGSTVAYWEGFQQPLRCGN
jgi:hypothetical protein